MLRLCVVTFFVFLLMFTSRLILTGAILGVSVATWGYYGYTQIACHPMFSSSSNAKCGSVQTLSAELSLEIVKALAPYRQVLFTHQVEIVLWTAFALSWALIVELAFVIFEIRRKRPVRKNIFKA